MTLKIDEKCVEELTCRFKIDIRNLTNCDPSTRRSKKITFIGLLLRSVMLFELKKFRGVTHHGTEEWCKNWRGIETDMRNLTKFETQALKSLKNVQFYGFHLNKVCIVWPKKVLRIYLSWQWRVLQNLKKNWLVVWKMAEEIWQILTWALKSLKIFNFIGLRLSKVYIVSTKTLQRNYLSWHWRVIQNLERNCLAVSNFTWGIWQILTQVLESLKIFNFNWLLLTKV